jgi:hypothetical protein
MRFSRLIQVSGPIQWINLNPAQLEFRTIQRESGECVSEESPKNIFLLPIPLTTIPLTRFLAGAKSENGRQLALRERKGIAFCPVGPLDTTPFN